MCCTCAVIVVAVVSTAVIDIVCAVVSTAAIDIFCAVVSTAVIDILCAVGIAVDVRAAPLVNIGVTCCHCCYLVALMKYFFW